MCTPGSTCLDLNRMPRPAKDAKFCKINKQHGRYINLFKNKRCKGWWPVTTTEEGEQKIVVRYYHRHDYVQVFTRYICGHLLQDMFDAFGFFQGKVEAELQLLTAEEAERAPVGLGRDDPEALAEPK